VLTIDLLILILLGVQFATLMLVIAILAIMRGQNG
jgi:hypothetical protein